MTAACVTAHTSSSARKAIPSGFVPELNTIVYLDMLSGDAVESVATKYGLRPHQVAERFEAARLCYERQIEMPGFPMHLL